MQFPDSLDSFDNMRYFLSVITIDITKINFVSRLWEVQMLPCFASIQPMTFIILLTAPLTNLWDGPLKISASYFILSLGTLFAVYELYKYIIDHWMLYFGLQSFPHYFMALIPTFV